MKTLINATLISGLVASILTFPQPAAADLVKDIAVGTATNVVIGELMNNGRVLPNAAGGAATGAVINVTHRQRDSAFTSWLQDAAVGAATNVVTGEVLDNGNAADNAIGGAVTGTVIHIAK